MSDVEIEAVQEPQTWSDVFDEKAIVVLQLADAMCGNSSALSDELIDGVGRHFDEPEVAELIAVCGQANLNNRVGNAAKQLLGRA